MPVLYRGWPGGQTFPNAANTGAVLPAETYNSVILSSPGGAPVGFWESDGTDLTGNGNTAVLAGTPGTTGMPNGDLAMTFGNSASPPSPAQYATIPTQPYFSPATLANGGANPGGILTVEAWIAPAVDVFANQTGTGYAWWAGKGTASGSSGNQEWSCRMYGLGNTESPTRYNRISGYCYNPAGALGVGAYWQVPAAGPVPVSPYPQWLFYTLVINTTSTSSTYPMGYVTIYRNGVNTNKQSLSGEGGITPVYGPGGVTPAPVRIGTRNFESYFQGAVGKFALYDYEPSAAQVQAHYQAMISFPASLYDVVSGSTAADAVTAGYPSNAGWSYTTGGGWSYSGTPVLSSLAIGSEGVTISAAATTLQGCSVTGPVTVASGGSVSGTVISNSIITSSGSGAGIALGDSGSHIASDTTITGCTISGTNATTGRLATGIADTYGTATGLQVTGCDIYWCRTGLNVTTGTIAGNYIHDPGYQGGDQADGILSPGSAGASSYAAGLTILNNAVLNSLSQDTAVNLAGTASTAQYVTVEGNLLAGGAYALYGGGAAGNHITVTGNRFSQAYHAASGLSGQATAFSPAGSNTWTGNVVHDTGVPVPLPRGGTVNYFPVADSGFQMWETSVYPSAKTQYSADMATAVSLGFGTMRVFLAATSGVFNFTGGPTSTQLSYLQDFYARAKTAGAKLHLTMFDQFGDYGYITACEAWLSAILSPSTGLPDLNNIAVIEIQNETQYSSAASYTGAGGGYDGGWPLGTTGNTTGYVALEWAKLMIPYIRTLAPGIPVTGSTTNAPSGDLAAFYGALNGTAAAPDWYEWHCYAESPPLAQPALAAALAEVGNNPALLVIGETGFTSVPGAELPSSSFGTLQAQQYEADYIQAVRWGCAQLGLPEPAPWILYDIEDCTQFPSGQTFGLYDTTPAIKLAGTMYEAIPPGTAVPPVGLNGAMAGSQADTNGNTLPARWYAYKGNLGGQAITAATDGTNTYLGNPSVLLTGSSGTPTGGDNPPALQSMPCTAPVIIPAGAYTFTIALKAAGSYGSPQLQIAWYDDTWTYISNTNGSVLTLTSSFAVYTLPGTAPPGAAIAELFVSVAGNAGSIWASGATWAAT